MCRNGYDSVRFQLWVGCGRQGELVTFDAEKLTKKHSIFVETRGISKLVRIQDKVRVGVRECMRACVRVVSEDSVF